MKNYKYANAKALAYWLWAHDSYERMRIMRNMGVEELELCLLEYLDYGTYVTEFRDVLYHILSELFRRLDYYDIVDEEEKDPETKALFARYMKHLDKLNELSALKK